MLSGLGPGDLGSNPSSPMMDQKTKFIFEEEVVKALYHQAGDLFADLFVKLGFVESKRLTDEFLDRSITHIKSKSTCLLEQGAKKI